MQLKVPEAGLQSDDAPLILVADVMTGGLTFAGRLTAQQVGKMALQLATGAAFAASFNAIEDHYGKETSGKVAVATMVTLLLARRLPVGKLARTAGAIWREDASGILPLRYTTEELELIKQARLSGGRLFVNEAGELALQTGGKLTVISNSSCFAAGTPLLTPTGDKLIEEFRPGDLILSRPEWDVDGGVEVKAVEEVFVRVAPVLNLHVGAHVIRTTGEHPFYALGRGWVFAQELAVGDKLSTHEGRWVAVEGVTDSGEVTTVYNVRVADYHTYFVGCAEWGFSVWAHNLLSCVEIDQYAAAFAKAAQENGGSVPKGVWDRIAPGKNLAEADRSAIRNHIRNNPDKYPGVNIKPRGLDGPIGSPAVRTLDGDIAGHLEGQGWTLQNGAGSGNKQEWIAGSGPGRTGGTAVDVKATRVVDGQTQTVRVQTVTTLADGETPTLVEQAAADRIRAAFPNDKLILVPKGAPESVWKALLSGL